APGDQRRVPVEGRVPDLSRLLVRRIAREQDRSAQAAREIDDVARRDRDRRAVERPRRDLRTERIQHGLVECGGPGCRPLEGRPQREPEEIAPSHVAPRNDPYFSRPNDTATAPVLISWRAITTESATWSK